MADEVWAVNADYQLLKGDGASWTQVSGALMSIAVGSNGDVWGLNAEQQIWKWNGADWTQIPGSLISIAVGSDGQVWGLNEKGQIFRWGGAAWTQIAGALIKIAVNAGQVWGLNDKHQIWKWNGTAWTQIPGSLMSIAVGSDGEVWGFNTNHQIFRWAGTDWTQISGSLVSIAVNGGQVWGLNADHQIWKWSGTAWTQIPGSLVSIAVGSDGQVWGINGDHDLWKWSGTNWTQTPGSFIAVAAGVGVLRAPEPAKIDHIFVLMLENRSYDHFLGFQTIKGTDAQTDQPTVADGLSRDETNVYEGVVSTVSPTAPDMMTYREPQHQFKDVLIQLCGPEFDQDSKYPGGPYPTVNGTGYASAYGIHTDRATSGEIMRCISAADLPVLTSLATEFVLCDRWFSAMAGPTEPNRMFTHAATSGDWDDSPSGPDQFFESFVDGIKFPNGTIYDRLREKKLPFRIYAGDHFPNVALLSGINLSDVDPFSEFASDLKDPFYDAFYTFIEPDYETAESFLRLSTRAATSQHPPNSVSRGEKLIKQVYEAIRNSPHWNSSMLIITWDEHGGFFDHVLPPRAVPTGSVGKKRGFLFDQYGPRVPAIVISPLCPEKRIEHRHLEHSVIPATVEQVFGLRPMTVRDSALEGLQTLATLKTPRTNTPTTRPDPIVSKFPDLEATARVDPSSHLSSVEDGWLVSTLAIAMKAHVEAEPANGAAIRSRVVGLKTVGDLTKYYNDVFPIIKSKEIVERQRRVTQRKTPHSA